MVQLGANRYGKAEVRVLRVARGTGLGGGDVIRDWNVSTSLSGDLAATHLTGDNSAVLATDTQKNTVYAFAQKLGPVEPEVLGLELAAHFVGTQPQITRARVAIEEYGWAPIGETRHSFARTGEMTRVTRVVHDAGAGVSVVSGLENLVVLNTTNSEFWGFPRDEYTTLAETRDRMLATQVSAWWRYRGAAAPGTGAGTGTGDRMGRHVRARPRSAAVRVQRDLQLLAAADAVRRRRADHRGRAGGVRGPAGAAEQAPLPGGPGPVRAAQRQ